MWVTATTTHYFRMALVWATNSVSAPASEIVAVNTNIQIVADIGGTNARFAYVSGECDGLQGIDTFPCADFTFFIDAIRAYMSRDQVGPVDRICLAVAGPVEADWIDLPNNHWAFSQLELEQALDVQIEIINDFSAQVLSIDALADSDLQWLGSPRPQGNGVKAVLGPGTGLGVAAMLPSGEIIPSEAGHIGFAPVDTHGADLLNAMWHRYHRVSIERLLSGTGLANLYWANCRLDGHCRELPAPEVTAGARAGDEYCCRAVGDFLKILATAAGDVALMMGATDGVYLSGGILPRITDFLQEDSFRQQFEDKGRFREFNSAVPLAIVHAEYPGLLGSVEALRRSKPAG
jgi:glucokinase